MDEAERTEGAPVETTSQDPEQIRGEIEETREEVGATVDALAAKADVKGQAQAKAEEAKGQARAKAESVKEQAARAKQEAQARTPESATAGAEQVAAVARENPVPTAAIGAFMAGVLVGYLLGRR